MRLVDAPIDVALAQGRLARFRWQDRIYRVTRIVDQWSYLGRWWAGEGEWRFYRVETADGGLFELYWDAAADQWRLYRVYD
ncbi:MAG: DUF6504 family protein [Limnochordales bacterium]|nr:DUF6504 family protein [Limnochordales bacterium]